MYINSYRYDCILAIKLTCIHLSLHVAPPPRVSNKPSSDYTHKPPLSKSVSIDPLPPVFGEDDYIEMDPETLTNENRPLLKCEYNIIFVLYSS